MLGCSGTYCPTIWYFYLRNEFLLNSSLFHGETGVVFALAAVRKARSLLRLKRESHVPRRRSPPIVEGRVKRGIWKKLCISNYGSSSRFAILIQCESIAQSLGLFESVGGSSFCNFPPVWLLSSCRIANQPREQ